MKALLLTALLPITVLTCQQEEKITDTATTETTQTQLAPQTTTPATPKAELKPAEVQPALSVETIDDGADLGKAIFTENGKTVIVFNTVSQKGKIRINGKDYVLNKYTFSENNYEISGDGVSITASNGSFQDMVSDCAYGTFPEVTVKLNGKETKLKDIKVQDCPNYN